MKKNSPFNFFVACFMFALFALPLVPILTLQGCAINRPVFRETVAAGVTNRELRVSSWALWPATSEVAKQKASMGKTWSLGTEGLREDGGGTNVVDALRELNKLLGK